jgi:hypothetical protein
LDPISIPSRDLPTVIGNIWTHLKTGKMRALVIFYLPISLIFSELHFTADWLAGSIFFCKNVLASSACKLVWELMDPSLLCTSD